jgi:glycine/D-amino acid oxidase-like deaminating enzyme
MWDALIIGGGFYGTAIATYLAQRRRLGRVILIEREHDLLQRASANNQARVHNGYHYPRSLTTAFRSRVNLPRFVSDYPDAVVRDFTKLYAIARRNSSVTSRHFEKFCREIGAAYQPASVHFRSLFDPRLIEAVFQVEEYAFDWQKLRDRARVELRGAGVEVRFDSRVVSLVDEPEAVAVECRSEDGRAERHVARMIFNCTYSGLNQLAGNFPGTRLKLKHEITEMALVDTPPELSKVGVTVMDGAFFSMMPYPSRGLHSLSHVRYTPHQNWLDEPGLDPYARLDAYARDTRVERMIRDVARYMPAIRGVRYVDSLFEVKTVLTKNETDDGRPILFERHADLPRCYSVLGGKIDNIYDVLEKLDAEDLPLAVSGRLAVQRGSA